MQARDDYTMLTEASHQTVQQLLEAGKSQPGAMLPLLHDIQDTLGYVPAEAVGDIAQALNVSRAEVHGVITFYHHFRQQPAGRHVVQVCRAEACQSMGGEALWAHACGSLGVDAAHGGTTADAAVTLQPVYCLGLCSSSPALALDDKVHARMDATKLDRLLAAARSAA